MIPILPLEHGFVLFQPLCPIMDALLKAFSMDWWKCYNDVVLYHILQRFFLYLKVMQDENLSKIQIYFFKILNHGSCPYGNFSKWIQWINDAFKKWFLFCLCKQNFNEYDKHKEKYCYNSNSSSELEKQHKDWKLVSDFLKNPSFMKLLQMLK